MWYYNQAFGNSFQHKLELILAIRVTIRETSKKELLIESFSVELSLYNGKSSINCPYNPHKSLIANHLDA